MSYIVNESQMGDPEVRSTYKFDAEFAADAAATDTQIIDG